MDPVNIIGLRLDTGTHNALLVSGLKLVEARGAVFNFCPHVVHDSGFLGFRVKSERFGVFSSAFRKLERRQPIHQSKHGT